MLVRPVGRGRIWRRAPDGHESTTRLIAGVCVDITLGTAPAEAAATWVEANADVVEGWLA